MIYDIIIIIIIIVYLDIHIIVEQHSLKCNQLIMLKKSIIIQNVSSFFCGIFKWEEHFLSPEVAYSISRQHTS